jgi:hypothetical protein
MLKIAQVIDRETRMNKMWNDEEGSDDADETFGAEEKQDKKRSDKNKNQKQESNSSKRPNKEKFAQIMKNQDAFPTLENEFLDDEDEDEVEVEATSGNGEEEAKQEEAAKE